MRDHEKSKDVAPCAGLTAASPVAQSVAGVLSLVMGKDGVHQAGLVADSGKPNTVAVLDASADGSNVVLKGWIGASAESETDTSWILAHYPSLVGAGDVLQLVTWLRSELMWDGGFVAVVNSEQAEHQIREALFFGQQDVSFSFGAVPGHAVTTSPLILGNLVDVLVTVGSISADCWFDLVRCSGLGNVRESLRNAATAIDNGDLTTAYSETKGALGAVRGANLATILDHQKWNTAKRLMGSLPVPLPETEPAVRSALSVVEMIEAFIFGRGTE
ncbi:MAG: hypothetical protein HN976_13250 [Lentisphaerae bacterium]|nr:hypothetical protein [Lentisphaerota bacterium]